MIKPSAAKVSNGDKVVPVCPRLITFTVPGQPIPKGRPRAALTTTGVRLHTPAKTLGYENRVRHYAEQAMAGRRPIQGAVAIHAVLYLEIPRSWGAQRLAEAVAGNEAPIASFDIDNAAKSLLDGCNGVVYVDDKQVTRLTIEKAYGLVPGAHMEVTPL